VNCTVWWGLMARLQLAGPKCQAGGAPTWAADTWHLAAKPRCWDGTTRWQRYKLQPPGARSPSLGRLGCLPVCWVDQAHM